MKTAVRIYRNAEGELVGEGDTSAVVLAYGLDDEVEPSDESAVKKLQPKGKAAEKLDEPTEAEKVEKVVGEAAAAKPEGDPVVESTAGTGDRAKPAKKTAAKKAASSPAKDK